MTAEIITFRVKQRMKPGTIQVIAGQNLVVFSEDGTVLSMTRIEDGPPEIDNEDWAAEQRLAQAALERD